MLTNFLPLILGISVVFYLAVEQLQTKNYPTDKLWAIPLLLLLGAVVTVATAEPQTWTDQNNIFLLIISATIGVVSGVVRGSSNRVERQIQTGQIVLHGSVSNLLSWIVTVAIYVSTRTIVSGHFGFDNAAALASLLLFFGFTLSFQRGCWYLKTSRQALR